MTGVTFIDVIHAVGPRDKDPNVLKSAYESSLALTLTHRIQSVVINIFH